MDPTLRLRPGQEQLTPAQEAEAQRFAEEYLRRQLSTEPVDEPEAAALLRQAYIVARMQPPARLQWLDGPLQLIAVLASLGVADRVHASVGDSVRDSVSESVRASLWASVRAYDDAPWHSSFQFFDVYLAPNALHALGQFNQLVSGYWLDAETVLLVRHPRLLSCDEQGRLHSTTGKCLEYHDGWGFYAWHGVLVPERVILAPEALTREDFVNERNVEVRRIIQERMGSRFVSEMRGKVLDRGPRGTLYEVKLPRDPERVARYIQVQDASPPRQYFLRVPPTIQTAAEAVAWSFGLLVEDYHPAQET